jgi:uncharacterized membrane protein YfcA
VAGALLGPGPAAALLLVTDAAMSAGMLPNGWRRAERGAVFLMAAGAFLGVPAGAWVLARLDPLATRWICSALVAATLVFLISGWRHQGRPVAPLTIVVGLFAGLMGGLAQMGGPVVIAYWLGGAHPPERVRANIILYFGFSTLFAIASYAATGLLDARVLLLALITAPVYGLSLYAGTRLFGRADERVFRWACYGLVLVALLVSLPVV